MKKLILILLCGFLILSLTACGTEPKDDPSLGGQNSPAATVGLFSNYVEKGDYESAKTFFIYESKNNYLVKMEEIHEFIKSDKIPATSFDDIKIIGDTAQVPTVLLDNYNDNKYYMFYLNKTEDGWLITSIN